MTASDFNELALALGLDNTGFAAALGIDVRRVRAYAIGKPIPQVVTLAAWALMMQPRVASAREMLVEKSVGFSSTAT